MKYWLRFFGFLDALSILLIAPQILLLLKSFDTIPPGVLYIISVLRIVLFLSLFVSAAGLIMLKKVGGMTYYIQFLFRFFTLIFSFGFITYLNDFFPEWQSAVRVTLTLVVFGEFLRLYFTYKSTTEKKFSLK